MRITWREWLEETEKQVKASADRTAEKKSEEKKDYVDFFMMSMYV